MQQWVVEIAYESRSGPRQVVETIYMPTENDVRAAISSKGGHVLTIRPHKRTSLERLLARSGWWQVQLLRGIMFRSTSTSPGVALWKIIEAETNPTRQNILAPAREALSRGAGRNRGAEGPEDFLIDPQLPFCPQASVPTNCRKVFRTQFTLSLKNGKMRLLLWERWPGWLLM